MIFFSIVNKILSILFGQSRLLFMYFNKGASPLLNEAFTCHSELVSESKKNFILKLIPNEIRQKKNLPLTPSKRGESRQNHPLEGVGGSRSLKCHFLFSENEVFQGCLSMTNLYCHSKLVSESKQISPFCQLIHHILLT